MPKATQRKGEALLDSQAHALSHYTDLGSLGTRRGQREKGEVGHKVPEVPNVWGKADV